MKVTKREIAEYYGITAVTLHNYEVKAKQGDIKYQRRLDAMHHHYIKETKLTAHSYKELTDQDGQTMYMVYG